MLRYKIILALLALFVGVAAAQQKVMPSTYTAFTESPYPETSTNQQKNLASDYIIYKGSMQPLKYTELIRSGTTVTASPSHRSSTPPVPPSRTPLHLGPPQ